MTEVVDVAVWAQAADDGGAERGVHGLPLGSDGDFAVVADTHGGLLAPDKKPPWASGQRAQDGALLLQRLLSCGVRGDPQLPVDFALVGVGQELVEQVVGPFQFEDVIGGQQGREAFLQVIMAAFDFAFGLRGGRVTQGDTVAVERGSQAWGLPKATREQPAHKARVAALWRECADEATDELAFDRVAIESMPTATVAAVA